MLVCESDFMIPNSAPKTWCVKLLFQQRQHKPSWPVFLVLSVSKGRLNRFSLLLLLVSSVRLNSSLLSSVFALTAVILLSFPLHLCVFLKKKKHKSLSCKTIQPSQVHLIYSQVGQKITEKYVTPRDPWLHQFISYQGALLRMPALGYAIRKDGSFFKSNVRKKRSTTF